jgi:DNA polymerase III gamma/tau subunit
VSRLQFLATKGALEVDEAAIALIAARANGSLHDAELTLDQLSLLDRKVSVAMVQELVGLVSDQKLLDLLDLALSADTENTEMFAGAS